MVGKKDCFFMVLFLAIALFISGCELPYQPPKELNGKLYGVIEGQFRHRWWHYYQRGLSFADGDFLTDAEKDFKQAIEIRHDDKWRARTYGMHFIDYFPHCELGVIKFKQGEIETAIEELETALKTAKNAKAEYYLDLARKTMIERDDADKKPPEISISSPEQHFLTNAFSIGIRGIAKDDAFVRYIKIGGRDFRVDVSAREIPFYADVPLNPGTNRIPIEVTDLAEKTSRSYLIVEADRIGPVIGIADIDPNKPDSEGKISVTGYVADSAGLSELTINNQKFSYQGQKQIQIQKELVLEPGETFLEIQAKDLPGNVTVAKIDLPKRAALEEISGWLARNGDGENPVASDNGKTSAPQPEVAPQIRLHREQSERTTYLDYIVIDGKVTGNVASISAYNSVVVEGKEVKKTKYDEKIPEGSSKEFYFSFIIELEKNEKADNLIEIKAASSAGYMHINSVIVKWRERAPRKLESRLRMAIWDFTNRSADDVEKDFASVILRQTRFKNVEHLKESNFNNLATETEKCSAAKEKGFDCVLFGRIKQKNDSVHINFLLKDDKGDFILGYDIYDNDVNNGLGWNRLAKRANYVLTDELPLIEGIVKEKPRPDLITVNLGEERKVKKGMDIIVYEVELIKGKDGKEYERINELGEGQLNDVKKESSLAQLMEAAQKERIKPQHYVITR